MHMLHLVPMWQSEERHRKLKIMIQDRPDLIQSELAGLAFDSLQQVCTVHTRARPKLERTLMSNAASPLQNLNLTLYTARRLLLRAHSQPRAVLVLDNEAQFRSVQARVSVQKRHQTHD